MTNFEQIQSASLNELALWIHKHGQFDGSPWVTWFDDNYCSKCEAIECKYEDAEEKLGFKPFYKNSIECSLKTTKSKPLDNQELNKCIILYRDTVLTF